MNFRPPALSPIPHTSGFPIHMQRLLLQVGVQLHQTLSGPPSHKSKCALWPKVRSSWESCAQKRAMQSLIRTSKEASPQSTPRPTGRPRPANGHRLFDEFSSTKSDFQNRVPCFQASRPLQAHRRAERLSNSLFRRDITPMYCQTPLQQTSLRSNTVGSKRQPCPQALSLRILWPVPRNTHIVRYLSTLLAFDTELCSRTRQ